MSFTFYLIFYKLVLPYFLQTSDVAFCWSAACLTLAELAMEAGLPNGVLNIIHGTNVSFTFSFLVFEQLVTFTLLMTIKFVYHYISNVHKDCTNWHMVIICMSLILVYQHALNLSKNWKYTALWTTLSSRLHEAYMIIHIT